MKLLTFTLLAIPLIASPITNPSILLTDTQGILTLTDNTGRCSDNLCKQLSGPPDTHTSPFQFAYVSFYDPITLYVLDRIDYSASTTSVYLTITSYHNGLPIICTAAWNCLAASTTNIEVFAIIPWYTSNGALATSDTIAFVDPPGAIPEPSTILLTILGMGVILARRAIKVAN